MMPVKASSASLSDFLTRQGFCDPVHFATGCSAWRNGLPHTFRYPEIETDPEKRAALLARIEEIANAPMPGRKKAKKKAEPQESFDAHADDRSPELGVALDVVTAPGMA